MRGSSSMGPSAGPSQYNGPFGQDSDGSSRYPSTILYPTPPEEGSRTTMHPTTSEARPRTLKLPSDLSAIRSVKASKFPFGARCDLLPLRTRTKHTMVHLYGTKRSFWHDLDQVQVLGGPSEVSRGILSDSGQPIPHANRVRTLCWSDDGNTLLSSGDDLKVCFWSQHYDSDDTGQLHLDLTIQSRHEDSVLNVSYLPHTSGSTLVTCSADRTVRVFDVNRCGTTTRGPALSAPLPTPNETPNHQRVIKCHHGKVKSVVTEDSPSCFLTVSDDKSVRQHDLREHHTCATSCTSPLVLLPFQPSTLSYSPLTPFNFVVAGSAPSGLLFDRRKIGRNLKAEWGLSLSEIDLDESALCVRRFGRPKIPRTESLSSRHVTGSRMAQNSGHELLLSFRGDGVYLFSTRDSPLEQSRASSVMEPNQESGASTPGAATPRYHKRRRLDGMRRSSMDSESETPTPQQDSSDSPSETSQSDGFDDTDDTSMSDCDDFRHVLEEDEFDRLYSPLRDLSNLYETPSIPFVAPRMRYDGILNGGSQKAVNFLGGRDEWITSGSDDGNFFLWSKTSGALAGIWKGDESGVDVVEDRSARHSHPMVAVCGTDSSIKIFCPRPGRKSAMSLMHQADTVTRINRIQSQSATFNVHGWIDRMWSESGSTSGDD